MPGRDPEIQALLDKKAIEEVLVLALRCTGGGWAAGGRGGRAGGRSSAGRCGSVASGLFPFFGLVGGQDAGAL